MTIAVLANEAQKQEWLAKRIADSVEVLWCGSVRTLVATSADAYVDLLFENDPERIRQLTMREGFPFLVNSVETTSAEIGHGMIRINAWPGMLSREVVETAIAETDQKMIVAELMEVLGWKYMIAPDVPGMISGRVIASIINEAYYTWGDGISSKEDIDTAMKLGTNYPAGPFAWAQQIGINKIYSLLRQLTKENPRYSIAPALINEIAPNL